MMMSLLHILVVVTSLSWATPHSPVSTADTSTSEAQETNDSAATQETQASERPSPTNESQPEADAPYRYGKQAKWVDLGLIGSSIGVGVLSGFVNDKYAAVLGPLQFGLGFTGVWFGGAISHAIHDNPKVIRYSIGTRLQWWGIGVAAGLGSGLIVGGTAAGICTAKSGEDCGTNMLIGTVGMTVIGATAGTVHGIVRDYKTLAVIDAPTQAASTIQIRPTFCVQPDKTMHVGVRGSF